jgi:purine-cytosine permease-like protein
MADTVSRPVLQVSYEDDPRVVADAAVDDYAMHVVPETGRVSRGKLMMAFWGVMSAMFYVVTGAAVAAAVGTQQAIIGILLTVVVYGLINKVISGAAADNGLTVAQFSRSMFGRVGAALATLIFAATAIYYFVFEGSIIGIALQTQFGGNIKLWYLAVCLYSIPLVLRGVSQWLDKLNGVLLPFYILGMVAAVVWAAIKYGHSTDFLDVQAPSALPLPGWLIAFCSYMGIWVLMMFTMDFARLGKREDKTFAGWVTFGPVFYLGTFLFSGLVGIYLANTVPLDGATGFGEAGAAVAIVQLMGFFGVLLILITQTRINSANMYLASSNLEAFVARVTGLRLNRGVWVVVAAAICYVLMIWGDVLTYVLKALAYQGVFVTAWVAIALVHIFYMRRTGQPVEFRPMRVPAINPGGIAAWAISVTVGIFLIQADGLDARLVILAPIITVIIAAAIYLAALRFAKDSWFRIERGDDPATEVPDPWLARIECASCDKSYIAREMDRDPDKGNAPVCAACAAH